MKFSHFTADERVRLEYLYLKEGLSIILIAKALNKNRSSIYRELKRGECYIYNQNYDKVKTYSAQKAQILYKNNMQKHGRKNKFEKDTIVKQMIIDYIKRKHYSPRASIYDIENKYPKLKIDISYISIYRYIYSDKHTDLIISDLPYKRFKKRRKKPKINKMQVKHLGKSIDIRPKNILTRREFGHWEMDTVVGPQGNSKKSFLVLTERKTDQELIFLLKSHTTDSVCNTLNYIESSLGQDTYKKIFKTISVDNGPEFSDSDNLEKSVYGGLRHNVYYCHPYRSYERGSNENNNRFIRRFYPKGYNFDNISNDEVVAMESFINNYPRKIFNGKNSNYFFKKETKDLKINLKKIIRI